jgi:hypothetical protein
MKIIYLIKIIGLVTLAVKTWSSGFDDSCYLLLQVLVRVAFFYVSQMVPSPQVLSPPLGVYSLNIGVELMYLVLGSWKFSPILTVILLGAVLILR